MENCFIEMWGRRFRNASHLSLKSLIITDYRPDMLQISQVNKTTLEDRAVELDK